MNQPATKHHGSKKHAGLSLIDVLVGIAIMSIAFLGIYGLFQASLEVIIDSKAKAGGVALLEGRLEYVRSLPYRDIGTQGGIPQGDLQETETISLNGIEYTRRVFVSYYDSPEDGTGSDDENGITQDYKRVKVEVSWAGPDGNDQVEGATYVVPNGIETNQGGGTLSLQAFDALGDPVENAEIHIFNNSVATTVDVTTFTDVDGRQILSGAPASSQYEITVSKDGYSTARTYDVTTENQAPDPGHLTVATSTVTTASFPIDVLSSVDVSTINRITKASSTESFADANGIASSSQTTVANDALRLVSTAGTFATSGRAYTSEIGSSTVASWDELVFSVQEPTGTNVRFFITEPADGNFNRLPTSELPGNDTGFTTSPVDLSTISTSSYQRLSVEMELTTQDQSNTPEVTSLSTQFSTGGQPLGDTALSIRGEKTIGSRADGSLIYKTNFSTTTDASGSRQLTSFEWDTYHMTPTGPYRVAVSCPTLPLPLPPATSTALTLHLADETDHTLRVRVEDGVGDVVNGATVEVTRDGNSFQAITGPCGQAFFSDLAEGTQENGDAYNIQAGADGYATSSSQQIDVSGASYEKVILSTS